MDTQPEKKLPSDFSEPNRFEALNNRPEHEEDEEISVDEARAAALAKLRETAKDPSVSGNTYRDTPIKPAIETKARMEGAVEALSEMEMKETLEKALDPSSAFDLQQRALEASGRKFPEETIQ